MSSAPASAQERVHRLNLDHACARPERRHRGADLRRERGRVSARANGPSVCGSERPIAIWDVWPSAIDGERIMTLVIDDADHLKTFGLLRAEPCEVCGQQLGGGTPSRRARGR